MRTLISLILGLVLSANVYADAPIISGSWQWNKNVKIDFIYSYEAGIATQIHFDNGEFCYINETEKELLTTVLSMRAQGSTGEFVCYAAPDKTIDGHDSRHIHRIKY